MTLRNYIFFVSLCIYMEQQSVVLATVLVTNDVWSYSGENGPDAWHYHYPLCEDTNASLQSPIDIDTDQVKYSTHCEPLRLDGYNRIWNNIMLMTNNGRSVRINIVGNMTLSRGGLDGTYRASHIHLHWGSDNSRGSEHTINGKAYPLEIHTVHYNTLYQNELLAYKMDKGLAVLGVLVKIGKRPNANLNFFFDHLDEIENPGVLVELPKVNKYPFLPKDTSSFYRYQGSLTTPGCYQTVAWTVFRDTITISQSQMDKLRSLHTDSTKTFLVNNYRPVQKCNGRTIISC